jgi:formylglycine-generating enzyme required for sulfatase activity
MSNSPEAEAESTTRQPEEARHRAEGRIEIDAAIVSNLHGRWFLPGAGKMEWFQDIDGGPEMAVVPAGEFLMGPAEDEFRHWYGPQRKVVIPRPFAVGRCALTFAEWDAAVTDGGCDGYLPQDEDWGRGDRPVVNVTWDDAQAYVEWLRQKTGKSYRLLSDAEWEYAARAGTTTPFWQGASITPEQANYDNDFIYGGSPKGYVHVGDDSQNNKKKTTPVKSFQPNPWGLYQVHGNVWEWCEDCWNDNYEGAPTDGSARTTGPMTSADECCCRVVRGGSFYDPPVHVAFRNGFDTDDELPYYGFRLARTLYS